MTGKITGAILALMMTFSLVACGEDSKTNSIPSGTAKFTGNYYIADRITDTDPVLIGNFYRYDKEADNLSVQILPMPGITASDVERTRTVLDNFAKNLIDVSISEYNKNGQKGLVLSGTIDGKEKRFFTLPINDAAIIISADPIDKSKYDGSSAFERIVNSFVVTNVNFIKEAKNPDQPPNVNGGQSTPKPVEFKNDYMKFTVPDGWEVVSGQSLDQVSVTPVTENQNESAQGISIVAMPKHAKGSDMEYARTLGSRPDEATYGKNSFAKFFIASVGAYNFVISNQTNTYLITITIDKMNEKMEKFLKSFEMVKHE